MDTRNQDMLKLENAFFQNLMMTEGEFGGVGLDCKRPFGNSSVEGDILKIIGAKPEGEEEYWSDEQKNYARDLYYDLPKWLKKKYAKSMTND